MSSGSTLRRYLAEYFELKAFRETTKGKWVRKHIFGNAALMFAMKTWLKANECKIITSKDDPEDRKCFIAQHAADHPGGGRACLGGCTSQLGLRYVTIGCLLLPRAHCVLAGVTS